MFIVYKDCLIEKIGNEYQTTAYNIGRYNTIKAIKKLINKLTK